MTLGLLKSANPSPQTTVDTGYLTNNFYLRPPEAANINTLPRLLLTISEAAGLREEAQDVLARMKAAALAATQHFKAFNSSYIEDFTFSSQTVACSGESCDLQAYFDAPMIASTLN